MDAPSALWSVTDRWLEELAWARKTGYARVGGGLVPTGLGTDEQDRTVSVGSCALFWMQTVTS